jgi:hypothetical protein
VKKLVVVLGVAVLPVLGLGAHSAQADPTVTVCHSVSVSVNGSGASDAGCTVLPPQ